MAVRTVQSRVAVAQGDLTGQTVQTVQPVCLRQQCETSSVWPFEPYKGVLPVLRVSNSANRVAAEPVWLPQLCENVTVWPYNLRKPCGRSTHVTPSTTREFKLAAL